MTSVDYLESGVRLRSAESGRRLLRALEHLWEVGHPGVSLDPPRGLRVSADVLWALSDTELAELGVQRFQGSVRLKERGLPGGGSYRWALGWSVGDATVAGCWLELRGGEQRFLLGPATRALVVLAARVAGAEQATVFRSVLLLQRACARSAGERIELPKRLESREIHVADALRIHVEDLDGRPRPVPVLVDQHHTEPLWPVHAEPVPQDPTPLDDDWVPPDEWAASSADPLEPEELVPPAGAMLHNWMGRVALGVDAEHVVQTGPNAWTIVPSGVYQNYVLTAAAADPRQPPEVVARFLDNPSAFLPNDETFDSEDYAARVIGAGEAPSGAAVRPSEPRDWTGGHEGGLQLLTPDGPVYVAAEQLETFREALDSARRSGQPFATWDGVAVPATAAVSEAVSRALHARQRLPDRDPTDVSRPVILLIRENTLEVEWVAAEGDGRRIAHAALPRFVDGFVLQSHQLSCLSRFRNLWAQGRPGALLCDDMGLGKTIQALTFGAWVGLQYRAGGGPMGAAPPDLPLLLVAPPSLLEGWLAELESRFPETVLPRVLWGSGTLPSLTPRRRLKKLSDFVVKSAGDARHAAVLQHARLDLSAVRAFAPDILLVGYQTLRQLQFAIGELKVGLAIADEVQAIKNDSSLQSRALRAMNYDFALALTGTPIENSWTDLWTICDFAVPGRLGSLADFRDTYRAVDGSEDVRQHGEQLSERLAEVFVRRTRRDTLTGLPPLRETAVPSPMPPEQEQAYRLELAARGDHQGAVLKLLQSLARVSLHPRLRAVLETQEDALAWLDASARTAVARRYLESWAADGHAVLVFVRSLAMQATLARALELLFPEAPPVELLNGQTSFAQRRRAVARVARGTGFRVLVVSPDVGGAGWNLQFACRSLLLERPFNPAVEAQMVARTWRLGQPRPVEVVAPLATLPDLVSFDEVLGELLEDKKALAESVLSPAEVSASERDRCFERIWAHEKKPMTALP